MHSFPLRMKFHFMAFFSSRNLKIIINAVMMFYSEKESICINNDLISLHIAHSIWIVDELRSRYFELILMIKTAIKLNIVIKMS